MPGSESAEATEDWHFPPSTLGEHRSVRDAYPGIGYVRPFSMINTGRGLVLSRERWSFPENAETVGDAVCVGVEGGLPLFAKLSSFVSY